MKSFIFVSLLVAAIAIPLAEAQILGSLPGLTNITGTVFCSANASVPGTTLTTFPNATVQLQCGGTVISTTTTNGSGVFSIVVSNLTVILTALLSGCRIVVPTPLSGCNVALAGLLGTLASPLQFVGNTLSGRQNVANFITVGFQLMN